MLHWIHPFQSTPHHSGVNNTPFSNDQPITPWNSLRSLNPGRCPGLPYRRPYRASVWQLYINNQYRTSSTDQVGIQVWHVCRYFPAKQSCSHLLFPHLGGNAGVRILGKASAKGVPKEGKATACCGRGGLIHQFHDIATFDATVSISTTFFRRKQHPFFKHPTNYAVHSLRSLTLGHRLRATISTPLQGFCMACNIK